MRTDIHTHAFHPKIAAKAVAHLNEHYDVVCHGLGTIDDLKKAEAQAGIERFIVLCAATAPAQVIPANNYAIQLQKEHAEVLSFGTIHPRYEDWQKELSRLKSNGIKGLKLHPDFQSFSLDDACLLPIIEEAQKDFIFQVHLGDTLSVKDNPSCPYKMAKLLDTFPQMQLIAAHLGGYNQWGMACHALIGRDIWLETSSCMSFIADALLKNILQAHDSERILFGSDYPAYSPIEEMRLLQQKAGLSDALLENYLTNADKLFGMDC